MLFEIMQDYGFSRRSAASILDIIQDGASTSIPERRSRRPGWMVQIDDC